ncbi:hypothetical protein SEMRO_751_G197070.1 [Seminavis robusta]|uniref:Uncharacterized protein n=1 Tax=Seminavis robusta TaxID=568900 RepID=A0A9N8HKQ3_9STRA|nr:hypothetical protein SEMRO_751_G197070.1 [Seminavis robusta]|eukprot:Sro751_g197070.1 n/a (201) ;mRNA; r:24003-24605
MNSDTSDDDFELTKIVEQRIAEAVEEQTNSQVIREHNHPVNRQHPREDLTALSPCNNTKSHESDGFDLMEIVAQRAADARVAIDSEQAQEPGFPKSNNQASHPLGSLMGVIGEQEHDNIPSSSIGMASLRLNHNAIAEFLPPGAYPVDGTITRLQEEDGSSGSDNEGENWEEENVQAITYPINHQGMRSLCVNGSHCTAC